MADNQGAEDTLLTLTADIVAAHVSNNSVAVNDLPNLIQNVHSALSGISGTPAAPEARPLFRAAFAWDAPRSAELHGLQIDAAAVEPRRAAGPDLSLELRQVRRLRDHAALDSAAKCRRKLCVRRQSGPRYRDDLRKCGSSA